MTRCRCAGAALAAALALCGGAAGAADAMPEQVPIDAIVRAEIATGRVPGAVLVLGDAQHIAWRQAWGWRVPDREPMTVDTVFDLASLTKVIVTTTAVLQLAERHRLQLDAPAARYWPAFGAAGKADITVRQLLTHSAGLRPDFDPTMGWQGRNAALRLLAAERPVTPPGHGTRYSDLGFIALGEIVQRVSGEPLERYARRHILAPLGLHDSGFLPPASLGTRIAPTAPRLARGTVHDPTARRMGGVAGHAGLFGSADDLARFAQALLRPGRLLSARTLTQLRAPQGPMDGDDVRTFGWQLTPPWVADREQLAPGGAIGHTGYTGTGLWIDFTRGRFLVLLTSRLQPDGRGDARPLRREVLALLAAGAPPLGAPAAPRRQGPPIMGVQSGLDVLAGHDFALLAGRRVGLLTHLAAVDEAGVRSIDRLRWARDVTLVRLFSPEHGLYGHAEGPVPSALEPITGLPVVSLYGPQRVPPPASLQDLDTLVVDLQDAGTRFFTYPATLAGAMRAATLQGVRTVVLDRPNPVGADHFGGPVIDADRAGFTGYPGWPVLHGMTIGEWAGWIADDLRAEGLSPQLEVVPMQGYRRAMRFAQTGLAWLPPSPNLTTPEAALLYPGVAWVEGAAISVGRGTRRPFQLIGAPWIDDPAGWAATLNAAALPGLRFEPADFVPAVAPFAGQRCQGVRVDLQDAAAVDAPRLGAWLLATLAQRWPDRFDARKTLPLVGTADTWQALVRGDRPDEVAARWATALPTFAERRQRYLLY